MRRFTHCVHILDFLVTLEREEQEVNLKKRHVYHTIDRDRVCILCEEVIFPLTHRIFLWMPNRRKKNQMKIAINPTIFKQPILIESGMV